MENPAQYKVPGQYEYEGGIIKSLPWYPPRSIDRVKTFDFKDSDIIIASYPKCGRYEIDIFQGADMKISHHYEASAYLHPYIIVDA